MRTERFFKSRTLCNNRTDYIVQPRTEGTEGDNSSSNSNRHVAVVEAKRHDLQQGVVQAVLQLMQLQQRDNPPALTGLVTTGYKWVVVVLTRNHVFIDGPTVHKMDTWDELTSFVTSTAAVLANPITVVPKDADLRSHTTLQSMVDKWTSQSARMLTPMSTQSPITGCMDGAGVVATASASSFPLSQWSLAPSSLSTEPAAGITQPHPIATSASIITDRNRGYRRGRWIVPIGSGDPSNAAWRRIHEALQAGAFGSDCNARLEPIPLSIAKAGTGACQDLQQLLQALPEGLAAHLYCSLRLAVATKQRLQALLAESCPPQAIFRCQDSARLVSLR